MDHLWLLQLRQRLRQRLRLRRLWHTLWWLFRLSVSTRDEPAPVLALSGERVPRVEDIVGEKSVARKIRQRAKVVLTVQTYDDVRFRVVGGEFSRQGEHGVGRKLC